MLQFPQNPQVNDVFQRWIWDGDKWVTVAGEAGTFLPITGGTMLGPIVLQADADEPLEPVTLRQLEAIPQPDLSGLVTDAQLTTALLAKLSLTGGTMSGPITLSNDGSGSQAIRYSQLAVYSTTAQMNTAISTAIGQIPETDLSGVLHLTGGTMSGAITLGADGSGSQAIRYSQLSSALGAYLPLAGGTMTGGITLPTDGSGAQAVRYSQMNTAISTATSALQTTLQQWAEGRYDPVGLTFSFAGLPTTGLPTGQTQWALAVPVAFATTIPASPTIYVSLQANPNANVTFTFNAGGSQLGTLTITSTGTWSTTGFASAVNLAQGQVVQCTATTNANIAGVGITIRAQRT